MMTLSQHALMDIGRDESRPYTNVTMIGLRRGSIHRTHLQTSAGKQPGFTLIEVLAALAIIGLGLLAAIQAVTQTVNNASYLRDKTVAGWVALNKIEDIRLATAAPTAEKSEGVVTMAGREWRWRMDITATEVPDMLRIEVNVAPAEVVAQDKDASIANATGFYGKAITARGLPTSWDPTPNLGKGPNGGANFNNEPNPN